MQFNGSQFAVKDGEGVNQQITYSDLPTLIRSDLPKRGANLCVIGTDPKSRRQVGHVWDGFANAIIVYNSWIINYNECHYHSSLAFYCWIYPRHV